LYLDPESIDKLIKDLDRETKAVKEELLRMCWFMRGGLDYDQAHLMTAQERELVNKIVKENLETTKETQLPFF